MSGDICERIESTLDQAIGALLGEVWSEWQAGRIDYGEAHNIIGMLYAAQCAALDAGEPWRAVGWMLPGVEMKPAHRGRLRIRCPWCEVTHEFEAGGDLRCPAGSGSPRERLAWLPALLTNGAPPVPFNSADRPLADALAAAAPDLRAALVAALVGNDSPTRPGVVLKHFPRVVAWIFGNVRWMVRWTAGAEAKGSGLLGLARNLYGVPEGVAAVRIMEAVTGQTMDPEARLAIQSAVDAWLRRAGQ